MIRYVVSLHDVNVVNYIDDFGGADHPDSAERSFKILSETIKQIGAEENAEKARAPETTMVFLGTLLDTEKMELRVTPDKLREITNLLPEWLQKRATSKRQLQSLLG